MRRRWLIVAAGLTALNQACTSGPPEASPSPAASSPAPSPSASLVPYVTPQWFKDGVLYEIFVRSFADSNGDGIGDLRGIAGKLDYIQSLGASAIWLTPIFSSPSYHGYDTTDYETIEPDFGTTDDLIGLVDAAHARGMKVVLDFVASHTSNLHPFFKDAYGNLASKYADWYIWKDEAHRIYQSFFGVLSLPSLNHTNPEVNRYFVDLAKRWMDLDGDGDYKDGVDGFRCDYALGSPHAFWRQLRSELKPLNPDALLLGEVWVGSPSEQTRYFEGQFDALFDFPVYTELQSNPAISGDGVLNGSGFLSGLNNVVRSEQGQFPADAIKVRFAGNHDTDRIATEVDGDPARQRLAAALVAALDGTPQLYYGEEIGMFGHKGSGPVYDEYRREPMEWSASGQGPDQPDWFEQSQYDRPNDGVSVEEEESDPNSLLNFYRKVYEIRKSNLALSSGTFALLPTDADGVWAFWRYASGQLVAGIFNFNAKRTTFSLDVSSAPGPVGLRAFDLVREKQIEPDPDAMILGPASFLLLDWSVAG